mgnify:CR=1 FL=1
MPWFVSPRNEKGKLVRAGINYAHPDPGAPGRVITKRKRESGSCGHEPGHPVKDMFPTFLIIKKGFLRT